jgi:hypothetical protein
MALRRRTIGIGLLAGLVLFFAADAVVFRSLWYFQWVQPQSALGTVAQALENVRAAPKDHRVIVALGDSRVGEGLSPITASKAASELGSGDVFVNSAVGGTTPRAWYYFLRDMQLSSRRVDAVVMMLTTYNDNDPLPLADALADVSLVQPFLSLGDMLDFPASFGTFAGREEALKGVLLKGYFYKSDVMDFLRDSDARIDTVTAFRQHGTEWAAVYPGHAESLSGMTFDLASGKLTLPPGVTPASEAFIRAYAAELRNFPGRRPANSWSAPYRRTWLGRIAELCRDAGVPLYVYRIPRGPLHHLAAPDDGASGVVADMQRAGLLHMLPATQFNHLEHPEYFFDQLHLNAKGREIFSTELAQAVLQRLAKAE